MKKMIRWLVVGLLLVSGVGVALANEYEQLNVGELTIESRIIMASNAVIVASNATIVGWSGSVTNTTGTQTFLGNVAVTNALSVSGAVTAPKTSTLGTLSVTNTITVKGNLGLTGCYTNLYGTGTNNVFWYCDGVVTNVTH